MTSAEFKAAFPAFKDASDAEVNAALARAPRFVSQERFGDEYDNVLGHVVAHFVLIYRVDKPILNANDVVTHTTEHQSTTRSRDLVNAQAKDHFLRTTYGQYYRDRAREAGMGIVAV